MSDRGSQRLAGARVLILGAGQIGSAVARAVVREGAEAVWAHTKTDGERTSVLLSWADELRGVELGSSFGDIFLPLGPFGGDGLPADEGLAADELADALSDSRRRPSRTRAVADVFGPTLVVDATNCATTLGEPANYPELSKPTSELCGAVADAAFLGTAIAAVRRSVLDVWDLLDADGIDCYTKVSTTALGGLGLQIPFTHGDQRGSVLSPALWRKLYLSGVHHQLLWALARTVAGRVKLIIPSAFVGFEDGVASVACVQGASSGPYSATDIPGVRSGENSVYGLQELAFIGAPEQMGVITKEEVADACISVMTGTEEVDALAALNRVGLRATPRGHAEWSSRMAELRAEERERGVRSVVSGNLGPFVGEQLLTTFAILEAAGSLEAAVDATPALAADATAVLREADLAVQAELCKLGETSGPTIIDLEAHRSRFERLLSEHPELNKMGSANTGEVLARLFAVEARRGEDAALESPRPPRDRGA